MSLQPMSGMSPEAVSERLSGVPRPSRKNSVVASRRGRRIAKFSGIQLPTRVAIQLGD